MRNIELLAPARTADIGIEAIRHGADAVYIGGPAYGARVAAANSVDDIRRLCDFAHIFNAKIYVTLNTILWDNELTAAERTVRALYEAGIDALIVQDLALLRLDLPPVPLHASTQIDNRTAQKAQLLEQLGFSQIVLARELSLDDISDIHSTVDVPLEAFVHGALCVSYSGRCYASQCCFGRSANRGCCAQFCRLSFDLIDGDDRTVVHDKHLLSLRDMCRIDDLEAMMDAGVSSFKIEGRLKDADYVKNVTAAYRRRLDEIMERRKGDYRRSSFGKSSITFEPDLRRTFNRGFTTYFLHGRRTPDLANIISPKAMGWHIGSTARTDRRTGHIGVRLVNGVTLTAGDGLCFISGNKLQGFRVNRVERDATGGTYIVPASRITIPTGTPLYRNQDAQFEKLLSRPTAIRTLRLDLCLEENEKGYALTLTDETGASVRLAFELAHEEARSPQDDRIREQLSRLGNTPFTPGNIRLRLAGNRFIPASLLADWRRQGVEALLAHHGETYVRERRRPLPEHVTIPLPERLTYEANVSNAVAAGIYHTLGVQQIDKAYELRPVRGARLMSCKYCIRASLGACLREPGGRQLKAPLQLQLPDGRRFRLEFDCQHCQMNIYATS